MECISMGLDYEADIFDEMIEFKDNIIYGFDNFD